MDRKLRMYSKIKELEAAGFSKRRIAKRQCEVDSMAQNQLEKQKEQLAKLNKQIKEENKIAQKLGRAIISHSNLKFEHLTKEKISEIAKKVANELKKSEEHSTATNSDLQQG